MAQERNKPDWPKIAAIWIGFFSLIGLGLLIIVNSSNTSTQNGNQNSTTPPTQLKDSKPENESSTNCIDVTSYDYNWDNDVKCTRPDGSVFYTDYAGGRAADPSF